MSSEHKILARIPISVRWRDMDSMVMAEIEGAAA